MPPRPRGAGPAGFLMVLFQIGLLAVVFVGPRSIGSDWGWHPPLDPAGGWPAPWGIAARAIGIALALCGGLLALDAALRMGTKLTPHPEPRNDAVLLVAGSFGLVRHPMYGGLILTVFGWAGPTHTFGGENWVYVFYTPLMISGIGLTLGGLAALGWVVKEYLSREVEKASFQVMEKAPAALEK